MITANVKTGIKRQSMRLLPFIIFGLALLFDFFAFMLQVAPGVMGRDLMHDMGINAVMLSVITGCYFLAYAGMQLPVGILLDRFGPRKLMTIALICCATGATLFSISHSFYLSAGAQLLMGASAAFAYISVLFVAVRWFAPEHFGMLVGLTEFIGAMGAIFGETPLLHVINSIGWRSASFAMALIALVLSGFVLVIVRDTPQQLNGKIVRLRKNIWQQLELVLRKTQVRYIGIVALLLWAPAITFGSLWGIPFLQAKYELTRVAATNLMIFLWIGTAVGAPAIGWISNRMSRRQIPIIIYAIIGLSASGAIVYMPDMTGPFIAIWLFLLGFAAGGTCITFGLLKDNVPRQLVGTAMGFNNMMVVIGGPVCQLIVGVVLTFSSNSHIGIVHYDVGTFQLALMSLPLCFALALVITMIYIKPTHCMPVYLIDEKIALQKEKKAA